MNFEVHSLAITTDPSQTREAVSALLHTILFHREFGRARPVDVECESLDLTYVRVDSEEVAATVNEKVAQFAKMFETSGSSRSQLSLSFYEIQRKKTLFNFKDEPVNWEQWNVIVTQRPFLSEAERASYSSALTSEIHRHVSTIIFICNSKQDHIPVVKNDTSVPFPFEIILPTVQESWGFDMIKRVVLDSKPGPLWT
ncbi:hypothetical protein CAOG_02077 [Capsaspora owczarzaki ATCC 30864]|uniref:Autophagy-related protein 101 n=1 Tax=Capsaspora owczarzaki (strain ATCC 30864) TaxID=595528 RepID=A0A0D2WKK5_CAPO3|nr:hypothetical protein CAOG_02077 [Capsaspora owczarzaki ATCC 30864]KJE90835.1 hypothetical protein CAOG_002077 [Capsaspora owczarzaki ATCC 30864]|eukprot:XP_004348827.1 hypothetical protein CAOG_02077 [Capsaspora owczarzaki ATCC 30864]